jgi:hypothetical protein
MGLDLYLLPVDGDGEAVFYSHMILNLDRNAIIGDVQDVAEKHGQPIKRPISTFLGRQRSGEHGYSRESQDPYGDPLQYVLAKHLKPLGKKYGLGAKDQVADGYQSRLNKAVFAFICALPDDYKIVLYWH